MAHGSGWGPPPQAPPPTPGGPSGWGPPPPGLAPPAYGPPPGLPHQTAQSGLHTVAMVLGILSVVGMVIGFIPCLGWINWVNIPFGIVTTVIGIIGVTRPDPNKVGSIVGTACGGIAVVLGFIRLVLGGGLL